VEEDDDRPAAAGVADEELAARRDVDGRAGRRPTGRTGGAGGERPTMLGGGDEGAEEEPAERRDLGCLASVLELAYNCS